MARALDPSWKLRARFAARACLDGDVLRPFVSARLGSALHEHLEQRPETAGVLLWPYQCSAWNARERVRRIVSHFDLVESIGPPIRACVEDKLEVLNLRGYSADVRLILDQPKWLAREGHLALNLFVGDHRSYSLAFSLFSDGQDRCAFIGGLQGRSTEGALDQYKVLTKDFHGMRPRDLLLDVARMFFQRIGVSRIYAVAESHRFFRHAYFGAHAGEEMHVNYDEIWCDRGGIRIAPSHFELPPTLSLRALEEVQSKKRGMYRKRNEMLEQLAAEIAAPGAQPTIVRFQAT
ncbi:VirK/YbjX family protein [Ramlibacter ginsenosidimutans]|uniref:VirK/YbjX family protein n=1 Tax=Ramlibacter ginsenosidimutans TaxID=502333 RepID=UPI00366ADD22